MAVGKQRLGARGPAALRGSAGCAGFPSPPRPPEAYPCNHLQIVDRWSEQGADCRQDYRLAAQGSWSSCSGELLAPRALLSL